MRKHMVAGALAAAVAASGGALALLPATAQAGVAPHQAAAVSYTFTTLDDQADPTFNQLLGINSHNVISGYFGSGVAGHPNKGYLLNPPYGQANYVNENFPGSAQTQVTGLNDLGDTTGFWVTAGGTNHGFVEWNGVFASYNDPHTPKVKGSVNQLLGINKAGDVVGFATDSTGVTTSWLKIGTSTTAFQFPGGTDTQAFGINNKNQIVGSYLDGSGVMHGFVLSSPLGPVSHWQSIDDPNGVGSTLVNGINAAGDLVGFYTDSAGNVDGMLAIP
jgi:hypothetical protein